MKVYYYQIQKGTRVPYLIDIEYNILYWSKGALVEVRLKVIRVTSAYVQGDVVIEE